MIMKKILTCVTLGVFLGLAGCSSGLLSVHKIDIQQGNALSQDAVSQLRPGMTPNQVTFLLGHPMVTDMFQPQRWDYVYYFKPGGGKAELQRLTVYFENHRLVRVEQPEPATKLAKNETE
jgi:outer membrane protein assembly factor BamE